MNAERQTVNRFTRCDNHVACRTESEADRVHDCDEHLCVASVRRDANDAAPPAQAPGDVKIAFAVKGYPMRASQTAIEDARLSVPVNLHHRLKARYGRTCHIQRIVRSERKMISGHGRLNLRPGLLFSNAVDAIDSARAVADIHAAIFVKR